MPWDKRDACPRRKEEKLALHAVAVALADGPERVAGDDGIATTLADALAPSERAGRGHRPDIVAGAAVHGLHGGHATVHHRDLALGRVTPAVARPVGAPAGVIHRVHTRHAERSNADAAVAVETEHAVGVARALGARTTATTPRDAVASGAELPAAARATARAAIGAVGLEVGAVGIVAERETVLAAAPTPHAHPVLAQTAQAVRVGGALLPDAAEVTAALAAAARALTPLSADAGVRVAGPPGRAALAAQVREAEAPRPVREALHVRGARAGLAAPILVELTKEPRAVVAHQAIDGAGAIVGAPRHADGLTHLPIVPSRRPHAGRLAGVPGTADVAVVVARARVLDHRRATIQEFRTVSNCAATHHEQQRAQVLGHLILRRLCRS